MTAKAKHAINGITIAIVVLAAFISPLLSLGLAVALFIIYTLWEWLEMRRASRKQ